MEKPTMSKYDLLRPSECALIEVLLRNYAKRLYKIYKQSKKDDPCRNIFKDDYKSAMKALEKISSGGHHGR